jgi:hypothetical protein
MSFISTIVNKFQSVIPSLTNGQRWPQVIDTTGALSVNTEGRKATYRSAQVNYVPIASATAPSFSLPGSATKIIRVTKIKFACVATTGSISFINLVRFSALLGGTSATLTPVKLDITSPAATILASTWSVAATTATSSGMLAAEDYEIVTASVSVLPQVVEYHFGDVPSQELILRGTSDFVGIVFTAVGTSPAASTWIEWTEE